MQPKIRSIGILTSGGDAPGLNAVIRSVVKTAIIQYGWDVFGIVDGFEGLVGEPRIKPLTLDSVSGLLPRGGSVLGCTNRGHFKLDPASEPGPITAFQQAAATIARLELEAVIMVGGDGSHRIARELIRLGVPLVGVPKTIDNDLAGTDSTFGFDTAVSFATEAIDRLHTTAESHGRVMVVEVMGRDAGWIALYGGLAGGADVILIPEIPYVMEKAAAKIVARVEAGKRFSIVVTAEGALPFGSVSGAPDAFGGRTGAIRRTVNVAHDVAAELEEMTGRESRAVVLGHLQRGGSPTASDRVLATSYGAAAVKAVADGQMGHMVAWCAGRIELVPIGDGVSTARLVPADHPLIATARGLGISFAGVSD
ncbi:MAG TPA: ATP-dependent 6-phosphofructokinase [Polyangia bacterium]|jgi:6-phosphofructokinase 1|nr:ATP-dependent 6-phosphofructokinase [Polyangia bacterium]